MPTPKKLKIALTGAAGFLGGATLDYFALDPDILEIRALFSKKPHKKMPSKVIPLVGELKNAVTCQNLVADCDFVLHFANRGFPSDNEKDPAKLIGLNILSTDQLLHAMSCQGVKNLIYASSGGAIYQETTSRIPFREIDPTVFRTPYAATKLISEYIIEEYARNFSICPTILRISNPFGLGQLNRTRQGFIGVLLARLFRHEPMKIWTSLDTVKDFIYIDDVLSAFDAVLKSKDPIDGIFNLGSGEGTSLMQVITAIEKVTRRQVLFELSPHSLPENSWTVLNCDKFKRFTGWNCSHTLEAGIEELWDHLLSEIEKEAA